MERDFLGLNLKDSLIVVKEEAVDGCKDSGFGKSSGVPWHGPNKVSALPHFMTFKAAHDEKMHLASSGAMSMAPDAFDANHKRQPSEVQSFHSLHVTPDAKMIPMTMSNPFLKSQFAGAVQNFTGVVPKHQFVGGVPAAARSTIPSGSFVAGATQPCRFNKATGTPAQLTIFYGGTVNVFDDITPEKAQAIMFLAGNGCISPNMAQQRNLSPPKLAPRAAAFGNQTTIAQSNSALSSPISVSSPNNNDEVKASKTTGMPTNMVTKVETPKMVTRVGPVNTTTMMPSAVPQFRKASLARFLEKRKERVMSSSPYNLKKPAEFGVADLSAGSSSVSNSKVSP